MTELAETVDAFNDQVRQRAGLDTVNEPPALPTSNGTPEAGALPSGRKRKLTPAED